MQRIQVAGEFSNGNELIEAIKRHRAKELAALQEQYRIAAKNYTARISDFNRTLNDTHWCQAQQIKADAEKMRQRIAELQHTKAAATE
jgi:hypothetical protein